MAMCNCWCHNDNTIAGIEAGLARGHDPECVHDDEELGPDEQSLEQPISDQGSLKQPGNPVTRDVMPSPSFVCPNQGRIDSVASCDDCNKGEFYHPSCPHALLSEEEAPPEIRGFSNQVSEFTQAPPRLQVLADQGHENYPKPESEPEPELEVIADTYISFGQFPSGQWAMMINKEKVFQETGIGMKPSVVIALADLLRRASSAWTEMEQMLTVNCLELKTALRDNAVGDDDARKPADEVIEEHRSAHGCGDD